MADCTVPALFKVSALTLMVPALDVTPWPPSAAIVMVPVPASSTILPTDCTWAWPRFIAPWVVRFMAALAASCVLAPVVSVPDSSAKLPVARQVVSPSAVAPVTVMDMSLMEVRWLLLTWGSTVAVSVRLAAVTLMLRSAYNWPPSMRVAPVALLRLRSRPALMGLLTMVSASAPATVVVMPRSRLADILPLMAILPAASKVKSPLAAATSPSMRTPTPASLAMSLMVLAYMPPRADASMA